MIRITRKSTIFLIILGLLLGFSLIISNNQAFKLKNRNPLLKSIVGIDSNKENLKISKISGKIHIDNNWSLAKDSGLCSGFGTYLDPYIIEDLIIDAGGSGSCIFIENSNIYFKIENCTLYNSGDGFWDAGIRFVFVTNGQLINNSCSNNKVGIDIYRSDNNTILRNIANYNGDYGISMYSSEYNNVSGNIVKYNPTGMRFTSGINCIIGNIAKDNTYNGIQLSASDHNNISKNIVNNNANGLDLDGSYYNNISGNVAIDNINGIYLDVSDNNTVVENTVSFNELFGIRLSSSDYNRILNNTATYNEWNGIGLSQSFNNTVLRNNVNNNGYGITLNEAYDNTIFQNDLKNNGYGFYLSSSNYNKFLGNNVTNNTYGLYLYSCLSNTFLENTIISNGNGLELKYSNENIIYSNNFFDNSKNVISQSSSNIWNSPLKFIYSYNGNNYTNYLGNYYDTYTGVDANNDGIGDISFSIGGDNDSYPLMSPFENYHIIDIDKPTYPQQPITPWWEIFIIALTFGAPIIIMIVGVIFLLRKRPKD